MFSDPVVGRDFFGRQEVMDLLAKRASALKSGYRQNVAIIGHQQLGKSSILRHFLQLHRDPQVLAFYVEIKLQAVDYFVDQFIRALLYQFLTSEEVGAAEATESLASLSEKAKTRIPKTVERIGKISQLLKSRQAEEAYSELFDLTRVIKEETGKHCIVILDEFHRLGEFGIKNAFANFGKRIMVQKDTMYLLASSAFSASRKILAEKLALLFGNFERVYLEAFDFETSFDFLRQKLDPLTLEESQMHFLVAFTDGHPFFLETVARRLKEIALSKNETVVSSDSVAETLLRLLYESQGVLNQYFMKLISPWTQAASRGSHLLILTELAKGRNKLKDIALAVNRNQKDVSRQIQELMGHELILKTGVFYRFHNKMFKFWLREVYEKKELSLLGMSAKSESFIECVHQTIREWDELSRMDISERLLSLMASFQNDMIEIGEKKRLMPHFTEFIKSQEISTPATGIRKMIARGHGRCWVCKITEEKASEKEVLHLIESADADKKSSPTKVLMALNGLDENAKLLAKEKRILTLGLSRINLLMDVYGKPPIIRIHSRTKLVE